MAVGDPWNNSGTRNGAMQVFHGSPAAMSYAVPNVG